MHDYLLAIILIFETSKLRETFSVLIVLHTEEFIFLNNNNRLPEGVLY
jgi:hypothetical protein